MAATTTAKLHLRKTLNGDQLVRMPYQERFCFPPQFHQRPPTLSSEVVDAYGRGDYQRAIECLKKCVPPNVAEDSQENLLKRTEHAHLVRAMCYQQMHDNKRVYSEASNVVSAMSLVLEVPKPPSDALFCLVLALWLRSRALEMTDQWDMAKRDLQLLRTHILEHPNFIFYTEGILAAMLPHMSPLILAQPRRNSITINMHCVSDRLRRVSILHSESERNNMTHSFRLIDDDAATYHDLAKRFHYRLCLRRSVHSSIHLNMWYSLALMYVSEMGLFKREDMNGLEGYALECKILSVGPNVGVDHQYDVHVRPLSPEFCEWSGLGHTTWAGVQNGGKGGIEFVVTAGSTEKRLANEIPCVTHNSEIGNGRTRMNGTRTGKENGVQRNVKRRAKREGRSYYLFVYPKMEVVTDDTVRADVPSSTLLSTNCLVPLAIGPIKIMECNNEPRACSHHLQPVSTELSLFSTESSSSSSDSSSSSSSWGSPPVSEDNGWPTSQSRLSAPGILSHPRKCSWSDDGRFAYSARAFMLANGKHLIIRELWDIGIPGKVWDSAFIITELFKEQIHRDPAYFRGKRILDLSTGTGFVGLYLAACLAAAYEDPHGAAVPPQQRTHVVLTDLDNALKLVRKNLVMNSYLFPDGGPVTMAVESLRWGDVDKLRKLQHFDIVLASDVVYEPDLFDPLIQTFSKLCARDTAMYLGYKRRGLSNEEEARFFDRLRSRFEVSSISDISDMADAQKVTVYKLSR